MIACAVDQSQRLRCHLWPESLVLCL